MDSYVVSLSLTLKIDVSNINIEHDEKIISHIIKQLKYKLEYSSDNYVYIKDDNDDSDHNFCTYNVTVL